ncbi:phytanoyl-CoA dioxygenase family protein [Pseudomonas cucumis]|uniref:phytanoyl-CoA dioxygenase family protein n=1 Tax=Pseudomonas cucumis TaxID=2954082 RepID=UPI002735EE1F|nr:phytanoyl-CoA dioxygenase family protein [Pseudomonas cucumis]WLG90770.1 phytanoyl-CoA dioxygenase family protein [Pseudomonas cucumis]
MSLLDEGIVLLSWPFEARLLARLQKDAQLYLASIKKAWMIGIANGTHTATYFDLANSELKNESFHTVFAAIPSLFAENGITASWIDDFRLRVTSPYPIPYVPWHWDYFGKPSERFKIIMYLDDVLADGGEFCYVPKSHHIPESELGQRTGYEIAQRMGYRKYPGKAGTMLLFDTRGVHGVMKNITKKPRIVLIISLESYSE